MSDADDADVRIAFPSASAGVRAAVARSIGVAAPIRDEPREIWLDRHRLRHAAATVLAAERGAKSVAWHEGGHAVAAAILTRCGPAVFAPGTSLAGYTIHFQRAELTPGGLRSALAVLLAGEAAELRYAHDRAAAYVSATSDRAAIAELLTKLSPGEAAAAQHDARIVVGAIVDHAWPAIRLVAHRLLLDRRISGAEVYRAVWDFRRRMPDEIVAAIRVFVT